jgi:hypothetical protein
MIKSSHNSHSYRILAVGSDVSQLSSGANLLTQAGYSTDLVAPGRYHLAIVSATFTSDEQLALRARLKQIRPNLPVLLLGAQHDSPDAFLAEVARHLRQKQSFRFGTRLDRFHLDPEIL